MKCITEGLKSLQSFERWSRHDEMTPYASVLEEWDDMVGDDWEVRNLIIICIFYEFFFIRIHFQTF